jgi:hypothetical protein
MANNIPDYMRDFDLNQDYGFTPVTKKPEDESKPSVDPKLVEGQSLELSKVKSDVKDIKSMMNEIFEIVNEKESISKEVASADVQNRFKELEKVILPFLYNLSKSDEPYIHWPNRGPIIKGQIERILKLTRG